MKLRDKQGRVFTITNIDRTITMVAEYMEYLNGHAEGGLKRFDEAIQAYWQDFYDKLIELKEEQNNKH
jgi:hypothetical protein